MSHPRGVTRRHFLRSAGAAAAALAVGAPASASAAVVPAIDTHTHFYDPTRPAGVPWPGPADSLLFRAHLPAEYRALARPHGVVGTVVVEASPWLEDNQWVLDLARDNPIIVGLIGNLAVGRPEFAAQLRRFAADPLFRGIRLGEGVLRRGLGNDAFVSDLRRLADRDLALDLLGGAAMLPQVERLAERVPGLRVVIDHLPFAGWDGRPEAARAALAGVAALPAVYAKVSNAVRRTDGAVGADPASYRAGLDVLWERFGADRVLFGSNWPVSRRAASFAAIHGVVADYAGGRGRAEAERFFWRNSREAYGWVPRGEAASLP